MDRRFQCTACGKCCYGTLPLTLDDALTHAARFPLALVWMPVPHGARAFAHSARIGTTIKCRQAKQLAVIVTPIAYIPPPLPCPELTMDGLCGIQSQKPARCRTMPFYAYRDERDQADLLTPRKGWRCDTSPNAPVVYRDRHIIDRTDFDGEQKALLEQAQTMRTYAEHMLKYMPWLGDSLCAAAQNPSGTVVTSLSSFLTVAKELNAASIAAQQLPILKKFAILAAEFPNLVEHQRNYAGWEKEMEYLARSPSRDKGKRTDSNMKP